MIDEKLIEALEKAMTVSTESGNIRPYWDDIKYVHDLICEHYGINKSHQKLKKNIN